MKIPLYKPYISKNEEDAISNVLKSGKLSRGEEVEAFEKEFATYVGKKYAVAVNSGTSGLHLAVRAMGWEKGLEIITTPFSYIASANALLFEGITPVFVDIDKNSLNIDVDIIEKKITSKTKGMLLVDILGLPNSYQELKKISEKYNLQIIEDACEAIGRPTEDFPVAKLGEVTIYGFHENKQITTGGEGGMIVTDNKDVAQKCWSMRDQGRSLAKEWMQNVILGFNFRMTELQAAFGREQLKISDKMLARREEIAKRYSAGLSGIRGLITPDELTGQKRSWFLYFTLLDSAETRRKVSKALNIAGIGSSTNYFPPIYNFPMYEGCIKDCNVADDVSERLLALPMFYEMTDEEVDQVVLVIEKTLK